MVPVVVHEHVAVQLPKSGQFVVYVLLTVVVIPLDVDDVSVHDWHANSEHPEYVMDVQ